MDDIDEHYRVIRPRHRERLAREAAAESNATTGAGAAAQDADNMGSGSESDIWSGFNTEPDGSTDTKRKRTLISVLVGLGALIVVVIIAVVLVGGGSPSDTNQATGDQDGQTQITGPSDDDRVDQPSVESSVVTTDPQTEVSDPPATEDPPTTGPPASSEVDDPSTDDQPDQDPGPTDPPPAPGPLTGTVVRSCGSSGNADCRIAVRSGPSTSDKAVSRLNEGDTAVFSCTVMGEPVRSTVLGGSTSVWARTERGHYVSMAYLDIPGWDTYETTFPC